MLSAPEIKDDPNDDNHHGDVDACDDSDQHSPMLTEQITGCCDARDPDYRAKKVENGEGPPAHAQHAGKRTGDHPHSENEAGEENCRSAITRKESLAAFEELSTNPKEALIAFQQRSSAVEANGESEVVTQRSRAGRHGDDPSQVQLVFGIGKEARDQQRGFARDWQSRVFEKQHERDRPVAIVSNKCANEMRDAVPHLSANRRQAKDDRLQVKRFRLRLLNARPCAKCGLEPQKPEDLRTTQEFDQRRVELRGGLLVREMANIFERDQSCILKIATQGLGRGKIDSTVPGSPYQ
jgi:hypothetical protein